MSELLNFKRAFLRDFSPRFRLSGETPKENRRRTVQRSRVRVPSVVLSVSHHLFTIDGAQVWSPPHLNTAAFTHSLSVCHTAEHARYPIQPVRVRSTLAAAERMIARIVYKFKSELNRQCVIRSSSVASQ